MESKASVPSTEVNGQEAAESDDEYDFRLFSKPPAGSGETTSSKSVQRIVLRSPTPGHLEPSFVAPRRPNSFYFTNLPSPGQSKKYNEAAVSGEDVIKGSYTRHAGAELPWRVTIIKSESKGKVSPGSVSIVSSHRKRPRDGKKRRIIIRKRLAAEKEKYLMAQKSQAEKDEAEKEKRTRRNREKKVKRRQKDKMKKTQDAKSCE